MDIKEMKDKLGNTRLVKKIKGNNSKTNKIILGIVVGAVAIALVVTIVLNNNKNNDEVLFPGITQEENAEIYAVLQTREIPVRRNTEGEVMVPSDMVGNVMLDMSMLGYPKTALPFDIFSDNTGFTTTEFEKKQYLLLNLQDRIERTLKDMTGVKSAIVTLNVPDEGTYIWEEEGQDSSGSVSIAMQPGYELSQEKVSAIKNLVSDSVPRLLGENVTVVNSETMEEYESGEGVEEELSESDRLDFESKVEEKLEKKIGNVLSLGYGANQYRVSATVVIDYDKMITEDMKYVPQEDGKGVVQHSEESRTENGTGNAGGVAGEENNTDVPTYNAEDGSGSGNGTADYYNNIDYVISYIKKQIEKDNVKLQKATVAIALDDTNLTAARKQELVNAASKAANIAPEDIVITSLNKAGSKAASNSNTQAEMGFWQRYWLPVVAGCVALLAGIGLSLLFLRRRKRVEDEDEGIFSSEQINEAAILERAQNDAVQSFITEGKKEKRPNTPMDEMKNFAEANPEIVAAMISSWLKEGEK